jgi:uncharacterized membrane protein
LISSNQFFVFSLNLKIHEIVEYKLLYKNEFLVSRTICIKLLSNKTLAGANIFLPLKVPETANASVPMLVLSSGVVLENLLLSNNSPTCVRISYITKTPYFRVDSQGFSAIANYVIYDCPVYSSWSEFRIIVHPETTSLEIRPVYPEPQKILHFKNRTIILVYNLTNCQPIEFELQYRVLEPVVLAVLSLFAIEIAMLYVLIRTLANRYKFKEHLKILKPDEKAVIAKIYEFKNRLPQKILYTQLGFSKPKVTRILQELEERQILERKTKGKEKIVSIRLLK